MNFNMGLNIFFSLIWLILYAINKNIDYMYSSLFFLILGLYYKE